MTSKLFVLVIGFSLSGFSLSSLSYAQSAADIRGELKALNQSLRGISNLKTASKGTKASILNQLTKIQSELSQMDFSKEHCAGDSPDSSGCARIKQDLQKRISTGMNAAMQADKYSVILIEQALTGLDTDLSEIQSQPVAVQEEEVNHAKSSKKHAKLDCTPAPPDAVVCNGEYYKKDNSVVSNGTFKMISEKALNEMRIGGDLEDSQASKAD